KEDLEYLERDVMIIYKAFNMMKDDELVNLSLEEVVAEGSLTASSATQAQIRKQRDNYKASGLKTRYSAPAKSAEPKKVAIPSSVSTRSEERRVGKESRDRSTRETARGSEL